MRRTLRSRLKGDETEGMSFEARWSRFYGIEGRVAGRLTSLLLVNRQCLPVLLLDLGELPVIV